MSHDAPPGWQFVGPYIVPVPVRILISEIQAKVCAYYELKPGDMVSARRDRFASWPRQVAMYLSSTLAEKSMPEIGRRFGRRDHTTVLHAIRAVSARRLNDPALDCEIEGLTAQLEGMSHLLRRRI
jgi:chromosomal replication initiator protein